MEKDTVNTKKLEQVTGGIGEYGDITLCKYCGKDFCTTLELTYHLDVCPKKPASGEDPESSNPSYIYSIVDPEHPFGR